MSKAIVEFNFVQEKHADLEWLAHWNKVWPDCKAWYLSEGLVRRPTYSACLDALRHYMPELEPIFSRLVEGVGGSDVAARFLSLYNPPPYLAGCSQAVWNKGGELFLIKNYDYSLHKFEGTLFYSNWLKPVIGMLDCAWGLLDGINSSGLVASLTFGGKKEVGEGFGAPLILRYILETSTSVEDAKVRIAKIPCHMAYNVILLDSTGAYSKVYLCPGREAIFNNDPVSTNHQGSIDWLEYAEFSRTIERYNFLKNSLSHPELSSEQFIHSFFKKPIFNINFKNQFGTLYTALYRPLQPNLSLLWQDHQILQTFDQFEDTTLHISLKGVIL